MRQLAGILPSSSQVRVRYERIRQRFHTEIIMYFKTIICWNALHHS